MTPDRYVECLEWLQWDTEVLAEVLGCDQSLTEAYSLGLAEVPIKLGAWLETLAQAHEALAGDMPKSLKGKKYVGNVN